MKKQFRLTTEGIAELETELKGLLTQRSLIAERIKAARELGDLRENAEYSTARDEQERLESRISEIENILANVEVIKKPTGEQKVQLGSLVKLKDSDGQTKEFQVVGTVEADPASGKISDESPIGQALLGKRLADSVEIVTPAETKTFKITAIS